MENCIHTKIRIISQPLRKLWELFHQLKVKHSYNTFWDRGLYVKWAIIDSLCNQEGHGSLWSLTKEVPNVWVVDQYLLWAQQWHEIRNKVHNKYNVLESSQNKPPTPGPWKKYCLPQNQSLVPKMLGIAAFKIKKLDYLLRNCLVDAWRMFFVVEQVFLLMGRFGQCRTQIHNAQ